jgi:hypothetical protein
VPILATLPELDRSRIDFSCVVFGDLGQDSLSILGVNGGQPPVRARINFLGGIHPAHRPPRVAVERALIRQIVVPDALSGAFEGTIPPALALGKCCLGALLKIDINDLDGEIKSSTTCVAQYGGRRQYPNEVTILAEIAALGAIQFDFSCRQGRGLFARPSCIIRMNDLRDSMSDDLIGLVSEEITKGAVGVNYLPICPGDECGNRGISDDVSQQRAPVVDAQ